MNTITETERTVADFVRDHGITATFEPVDRNPHMDDSDHPMSHFRVTLTHGDRDFVAHWSCGSAWAEKWATSSMKNRAKAARIIGQLSGNRYAFNQTCDLIDARRSLQMPDKFSAWLCHAYPGDDQLTAADVLDSLRSDAIGSDVPFEEWAADLGFDPDSRKAERIWHACNDSRRRLRDWLGAELMAELEEVEGL